MIVLHTIDPEFDFWKLYPEFAKLEEFKKLKKDYKNSSDIMWFIVLTFYSKSKFINIEFEDRVELLGKDYLKDKDFYKANKNKIQPAVDLFEKLVHSALDRQLLQLIETLDKRSRFLKTIEYDLETFDKYDKMIVGTNALQISLDKLIQSMQKAEGQGTTKSNSIPSLADTEDI